MTRCVDVHAHFFPPSLVEDLRAGDAIDGMRLEERDGQPWVVHRQGPNYPLSPELYDLEARFALMDERGIDVAAVSLSPTLLFYWLEGPDAADWARRVNDELRSLVDEADGRVIGVAHLPMQDPAAAVAEAERARQQLDLRAVQLAPMILDRPLDEDDHVEVLTALERLGLPAILHPYFVGAGHRPGLDRYYLTNLAGHPYQTAVGASRLIMSGVLDRLPELQPILVHGGGYLPYQIGRLDHGHAVRPEAKACQDQPSTYLRRFLFDTLAHSAPALQYLVGLVGADRVAYGTDFPYDMGGGSVDEQLTGVDLDDDARALIRGGNSARVLGLADR